MYGDYSTIEVCQTLMQYLGYLELLWYFTFFIYFSKISCRTLDSVLLNPGWETLVQKVSHMWIRMRPGKKVQANRTK
jgi:hypothetical protein